MAIFTENVYMNILTVVISLLAIALVYLKWLFTYWKRQGVYAPTPSIPFGNAKDLIMRKQPLGAAIKNVYNDIKSKGHRYGGFYFLSKPILILVDLDLVKQICTKDFDHFTNRVNRVDEKVDPLTGHLFGLKGSKWKSLRAKISPTFSSGKMKMMFHTVADCSKGLVIAINDAIKEFEPIDIKDFSARFTIDVIGSCVFGLECSSLKNPNSEFRKHGKMIFHPSLRNSLVTLLAFTFPEVLTKFKIPTFRKEICDFFMDIITQTVNYREENNIVRKDFMHLMIQLKNNINIEEDNYEDMKSNKTLNKTAALTLSEITAHSFAFFIAGFETSSTTTTYCIYELVQNPELQHKAREEVNSTLDKHGGQLTYDAITEMTYMDKCLNETLRKYPPLPIHTRECTKTYKVPNSDLVLEKGAFVFIPVMGIQHDPTIYPDPETFDPERFSEKNKAARHSAAWTPFGEGPRTCIGLRFGLMQTKVALAVLLKNYRFTLNSKTDVPLTMDPRSFGPSAKNGIWLNAEKV